MKNILTLIWICCGLVLTVSICGCGTHGSLKGYRYAASKYDLEKAVMAVIKSNSNIYRDTTKDYSGSSPALDSIHSNRDFSAGDNYYNDIKHYVTITITSGKIVNEYTFRYYGDDEEWANSFSAEIFICYAHDNKGRGGSEGNGGITRKMKKMFTEVFESEFVNKIDKELSLPHTETE